ncbi:hypothetical protein FDP41_003193 [Naegleria fowleri]|uniref:R3H domain-containing protein n=1 Tax=Naegleria fowleri TaxID=5763 RepID=A0A6A5BU19_NAEFO|nr:uncharacterized protein FDP41_003193 [Naegleria fowleri]KAF0977871.1 hypothetical protein FDP41_003193 [Naegleria fowleri]
MSTQNNPSSSSFSSTTTTTTLRPDSKPFQPSSSSQKYTNSSEFTPHSAEQSQPPPSDHDNNKKKNESSQRPSRHSTRGGAAPMLYVKKEQTSIPTCTSSDDNTGALTRANDVNGGGGHDNISQQQQPIQPIQPKSSRNNSRRSQQSLPQALDSNNTNTNTNTNNTTPTSQQSSLHDKTSSPVSNSQRTHKSRKSFKKNSQTTTTTCTVATTTDSKITSSSTGINEVQSQQQYVEKHHHSDSNLPKQPKQHKRKGQKSLDHRLPSQASFSSSQQQELPPQQQRRKKFQNHPSSQKNQQPTMEEEEMFWSRSYDREQLKKRNFADKSLHAFSSLPSSSSIQRFNRSFKKLKSQTLSEEQVSALSLHDRLIYELIKQIYPCLICSDSIARQHATWYCQDCFRVFHLNCVQRWVKEKIEDEDRTYWKCPACQASLISAIPTDYKCFCGKMTNPKSTNLEIIPHSCGDVCGKIHKHCLHPCTELCHPGPCNDCELKRDLTCYCGKEFYHDVKCNDPKYVNGISCENVCGKLLKCQKHYCPNVCHEGECEPCKNLITAQCYCGKTLVQDAPCHVYSHLNADISHRHFNRFDCIEFVLNESNESNEFNPSKQQQQQQHHSTHDEQQNPEPLEHQSSPTTTTIIYRTFSCKQPCKKQLPCGQHECDRPCHYGRCIGHKRSEWNVKPTTTTSSSEDDEEDIDDYIKRMGCYQQCRKTLKCGHLCTLKCHPSRSECMKCNNFVDWYCKCGRIYEKRPCTGLPLQQEEVFLECNDECRKLQRIKQLADAFQVDYEKFELPQYSQELIDFGTKYLHIIKNWEFEFDTLLVSDVKSACKQFAPMKRDRRALLHELSEHYKFTSVSVDAEPYRSVIVTRTQQSKRPSIVLSDVISDPDKLRKLKEKIKEQEELAKREEMKRSAKKKQAAEWMQNSNEEEREEEEKTTTSTLTRPAVTLEKWNASPVEGGGDGSENDSSFDPYSFTSIQAAMSGRRRLKNNNNRGIVGSNGVATIESGGGTSSSSSLLESNSFSALLEHQDEGASVGSSNTEVVWKEDEDDSNVKVVDLE